MSVPKHRSRLATLSEAVNVLRDALREFLVQEVSEQDIIEMFRSSITNESEERILDKCKRGESNIRNIIDINTVLRPQFKDKLRSLFYANTEFLSFLRSMNNMSTYRNWVCHPDFEDISGIKFNTALERIRNSLKLMGATEEARVVEELRHSPFEESYYAYHTQIRLYKRYNRK